jgi:hypothetical protein
LRQVHDALLEEGRVVVLGLVETAVRGEAEVAGKDLDKVLSLLLFVILEK